MRLGHKFAPPYATMGVLEGDDLIYVCIFHNFSRKRGIIEISGASTTPRYLTRPVLRTIFGFPFDELRCQLVVARISERKPDLVAMFERFGFVGYRLPRLLGRDEAEIILTLAEEDWRGGKYS